METNGIVQHRNNFPRNLVSPNTQAQCLDNSVVVSRARGGWHRNVLGLVVNR